jgi:hypothetical protein
MVGHLPSRRGGVLAAGELRERVISLAAIKADSIIEAVAGRSSLIVMGDFNASPAEPVMAWFAREAGLVNLSAEMAARGKGSYRYQGTWEMIDQVLVSSSMLDSGSVFNVLPGSFHVVDAPFLLTEDETYPGVKPFPAYGGFRWSGGYSDHLPVLVRIRHR